MSSVPTITLAGHVLNDLFAITDVSRPLPPARVQTVDVPGRDGTLVTGRTLGPRRVELRLWRDVGTSRAGMLDAMRDLAAWLQSDATVPLTFSDEAGRIRRVTLDGDLPLDEYERAGCVTLSLLQPDPICDLGSPRSATVPSAGSVSFLVGGTAPCGISVHASSAIRDSSTKLWGLRFDDRYYLRVALGTGAKSVDIDCATRAVAVAGATSMITLESDWPELSPGRHTVRMDLGSGAATLRWQERSL